MPWTKLKNIILAILVLTNVCLLSLVAGPAIQSRRQLSQAREEAIRFLRSRGVQVEEDVIPQSMELTPQVLERDLEEEARAAAAQAEQVFEVVCGIPIPWKGAKP